MTAIKPDRQSIEDKDRDVVAKFRSFVYGKERRKQERDRVRMGAAILIAGCTAVILIYIAIPRQWHLAGPQGVNKSVGGAKAPAPERDRTDLTPSQPAVSDRFSNARNAQPDFSTAKDAFVKIKSPRYVKDKKEIAKSGRFVTASQKNPPSAVVQKTGAGNIHIAEIITCRNVKGLRRALPQSEFSVQKDAKVYVWMDVRAKQLPCAVRHVYYINGRQYRAIPLFIRYPQTRTWSNISLNHPDDAGKWRVEVVTEKGEKLSQIEFTVVP